MTVRKKDKKSMLVTLVSLLAIILCGGLIIAIDSPGLSVKKKLSFGEQYLEEADYEHALANFQEVLGRDPENADAYLGAAKAYEGLGKRSEAYEILDKGYDAVRDERLPALKKEIERRADDIGDDGAKE